MWAAIKKALNSTLGTENFKPLNEIITGNKGLSASDNVYAILSEREYTSNAMVNVVLPVSFTPKVNGTIRIKADFMGTANYSFIIFKNNSTYKTINDIGSVTVTVDIPIQKEEIITFAFHKNGGAESAILSKLVICASDIDLSLAEYTTA